MNPRFFFTTRRRVVSGAATLFCATLLLLHSTGCGGGGGKKEATAETGTQAGSVTTVEITPSPGTVFIGRSTTFQLAWTHNAPPPTFTAVLVRYDDSDGSGSEQRTTLMRRGDSFVWDLKRDGDYDLEAPGVYYVELTDGAEVFRAAYIVSRDRSVPITKDADAAPSAAPNATQNATQSTGGETTTVHTVTVSPAP